MSCDAAGTSSGEPGRSDRKLPILDLSLDEKVVASALRQACIEYGFFYIINHGISEEQLGSVFQQSKEFFTLPQENKNQCTADARSSENGYRPFGVETIDPVKQTQGGSKECYHVGQSSNLWPNAQRVPKFKDTMLKYYCDMGRVGMKVCRLMAIALDLDAEYFTQYFTSPMSVLRLLHYNTTLSDTAAGIYACGEHCDYGMMTFLAVDGVPGLEVEWKDKSWIGVERLEGAFIVNIGDMLQRWTNDLFRSTNHRVLNTTGKERYSIGFFLEMSHDTIIECFPTCCSESRKQMYSPVAFGDYVRKKLEKSY